MDRDDHFISLFLGTRGHDPLDSGSLCMKRINKKEAMPDGMTSLYSLIQKLLIVRQSLY